MMAASLPGFLGSIRQGPNGHSKYTNNALNQEAQTDTDDQQPLYASLLRPNAMS